MGTISTASILSKVNATFNALGYGISEADLETDNSCDIVTLWGRIGRPSGLDNDEYDKTLEFVTNGKEIYLRMTIDTDNGEERIEVYKCDMKQIKQAAGIFIYMVNANKPAE